MKVGPKIVKRLIPDKLSPTWEVLWSSKMILKLVERNHRWQLQDHDDDIDDKDILKVNQINGFEDGMWQHSIREKVSKWGLISLGRDNQALWESCRWWHCYRWWSNRRQKLTLVKSNWRLLEGHVSNKDNAMCPMPSQHNDREEQEEGMMSQAWRCHIIQYMWKESMWRTQ
jgi:hypothetical protein